MGIEIMEANDVYNEEWDSDYQSKKKWQVSVMDYTAHYLYFCLYIYIYICGIIWDLLIVLQSVHSSN